ncbi:MAG: hypothetical protein HY332_12585 [Chloroflexi bacterium]|nr:hypothetical protein [Chloroflexota bacterium]
MTETAQLGWMIEELAPLDAVAIEELTRELPSGRPGTFRGAEEAPSLALRIKELVVHDTKKWFGAADIRLDALIVHGHGKPDQPASFYMPQTFRFPGISDGDRLPIDETGLLIFYGKPLHFVDIFITVSRDRQNSDNLATLLQRELQSAEMQGALGTLLGLAVAAPQVATVTAAIGAAALVGEFAYRVLSKATGSTVGLYRGSFLQYRDGFGIGLHPEDGPRRIMDFSFQYEILLDQTPDGR